ncbi:MAG: hypothetical protein MJ146_02830 [Clostridia bacterium]|nr:hypothetical protein [Clostridia bacterium]
MKKVTGLELAMYIVAGVFGVIFLWMAISSITYLNDYTAQYGITLGSMFGEALKYIISQSFNYLAFGLMFFFGGRVAKKVQSVEAVFYEDFDLPEECFNCEAETCEGCEEVVEA